MDARERLTRVGDVMIKPLVALPLILALAAILRELSFVGICRLDMLRYLEISNHVLSGGSLFDPQVFYASARLPLMLPLIASNAIGGWGEHVSIAWPFACSLATVAFAYLIALELFDKYTAAIAGLLVATFSLQIELGTQLLPDPIESAFISGAVYFGIRAIRSEASWLQWALASGFSLAVAYYTRLNAIVLLPGILAIGAILDAKRWKRSLASLAGFALAFGVFAVAFWLLSGDPFVDINKAREFYQSYESSGFIARASTFWDMMRTERSLLWTLPMAAIAFIGVIVRPSREKWLLAIWAIGFFVYLEWVSPLHGLDSSYRYIEPMILPLAVLAASTAVEFSRSAPLWRRLLLVAGLIGIMSSMFALGAAQADHFRSNPRWMSPRTIAKTLEYNPGVSLYVEHPHFLYSINYYSGFTLGRDTLEPADAPINADARLFLIGERPVEPTDRNWYLVGGRTPQPEGSELIDSLSFPGKPLRLYLIGSSGQAES